MPSLAAFRKAFKNFCFQKAFGQNWIVFRLNCGFRALYFLYLWIFLFYVLVTCCCSISCLKCIEISQDISILNKLNSKTFRCKGYSGKQKDKLQVIFTRKIHLFPEVSGFRTEKKAVKVHERCPNRPVSTQNLHKSWCHWYGNLRNQAVLPKLAGKPTHHWGVEILLKFSLPSVGQLH